MKKKQMFREVFAAGFQRLAKSKRLINPEKAASIRPILEASQPLPDIAPIRHTAGTTLAGPPEASMVSHQANFTIPLPLVS